MRLFFLEKPQVTITNGLHMLLNFYGMCIYYQLLKNNNVIKNPKIILNYK